MGEFNLNFFNELKKAKKREELYEYVKQYAVQNPPNETALVYYGYFLYYWFKDISKALKLYEQAAELYDNADAMDFLGQHYYEKNDLDKAIYWLDKAARNDKQEHIHNLGVCYHKKGNYLVARDCFFYSERKEAQFMFGFYRYKGLSDDPVSVAIDSFEYAAKHGYKKDEAYLYCGYLYQKDNEHHEAYKYFKKAAEAGSSKGSFEMALYLLKGERTFENTKKAIELLKKSGKNGCSEAYCILGELYANGELLGIEEDTNTANEMLIKKISEKNLSVKSSDESYESTNMIRRNEFRELLALIKNIDEKQNKIIEEQTKGYVALLNAISDVKETTSKLVDEIEELRNQCKKDGQNISEMLQKLMEKEEQLSEFLEKQSEQICEEIRNKHKKDIKIITEELEAFFGQTYWKMFEEYIRINLATGQLMFDKLNEEASDQVDYSGVCICVCSALEHQLKKIMFYDFQNYLENAGVEINKWPKLLTYKEGKKIKKSDSRRFTWGGIPYYLDINGKSNEDYAEYRDFFIEYAKNVTGISDFSISNNLMGIINRIEKAREKYRNPAAHTGFLEQSCAAECLREVVMSRKEAKHELEEAKGLMLEITALFYP